MTPSSDHGGAVADAAAVATDAPRRGRGRPPTPGLEERRRAQIIESAVAVFVERGYHATTMADIAADAGIGQGTLYRYVPSKRELLDLVFDYSVEELMGVVHPVLHPDKPLKSPADMIARIDAALDALTDTFDRRPELLSLVLVEAGAIDEELKMRMLGLEATVARMAVRLCEDAQDAGFLRPGVDPEVFGHFATKMLLPPGLQEVLGRATAETRARYRGAIIDLAEHALLAPEWQGKR
ncbi:TetR/AcrR family transcriptional regulator [Mycobacterium hubeiense]|uniref:TetR/AcrR family transcriptional regulator n=1 Tax=Mycobacterium hubeiense TaxID=1867256 RepID=UPI0013043E71|nr:TetR/AcrR family transcriptional regulator [Mycobacterium sp. QGD 101]